MLTLDEVRRDPRIQPTYIPALQGISSQLHRVQIRKLIQSVCSAGGVTEISLEHKITDIFCAKKVIQVKELTNLIPHVRELETAYEMGQELKRLEREVNLAQSNARQIIADLLEAGFLVTTGSAVVVCAGFPLEPAH